MSTINVEDMASVIMRGLHEYADLATDEMKKAVTKTANTVKKEIERTAPSDTGTYAKSWTATKTLEKSGALQMTVRSKNRYQIAHLLEKGHALRRGGREIGDGKVDAIPHIAPAEEHGNQMLEDLIRKALT